MAKPALAFALLLLVGCGDPADPDAGTLPVVDAAVPEDAAVDAGAFDAGPVDAGPDDAGPADAGLGDAGTPASPIGAVTGMCGVLDDELTSSTPHYVDQVATYPDGWTIAMVDALSEGAREILADGTAGGSSGYSEAFAFELLHRCEGATLVKTETEIDYTAVGSLTDILVEIGGERIGVSVTRAVNVTGMCTREEAFDEARAATLLTDKLMGVNESSMNVAPADAWTKQILFIHADTATAAASLMSAWSGLDAALRADTVVYVSTSEAMDEFLYFEDRCL